MSSRKRQRTDHDHSPDALEPRSFTTPTEGLETTFVSSLQLPEEITVLRQDARKQPGNWGKLAPWIVSSIGLGKRYPQIVKSLEVDTSRVLHSQNTLQESQGIHNDTMAMFQERNMSRRQELQRYLATLEQRRPPFGATVAVQATVRTSPFKPDEFHNTGHDYRQGKSSKRRETSRYHDQTHGSRRYDEEYQERQRNDHENHEDQHQDMGKIVYPIPESEPVSELDNVAMLGQSLSAVTEDLDRVDNLTLINQERRSPVMVGRGHHTHAVQQAIPTSRVDLLVPSTTQFERDTRGRSGVYQAGDEQQTPDSIHSPITTRRGQVLPPGEANVHRARARPMLTNSPLEIQPIPPFLVRDADNQRWVSPSSISSVVVAMFQEQASNMASGTSHWKHFARLVQRPDRFTAGHCVQCDAIKHKKHGCVYSQDYYACDQCVKVGRPCAKLIEVDGTMCLGWLPVQNSGAEWEEQSFWVA